VQAVVTFIMLGDWSKVGEHIPPITWGGDPEKEKDTYKAKTADKMPNATGFSAADNATAKMLFIDKGCITCHTIGSVGGKVGPDLTKVGAWGIDADFLREWIRDPAKKVPRMPEYWSKHRTIGPTPKLENPVKYGDTVMPAIPMTDQERELLVSYLLGLK
jgi:mono/diheme cytochrome c family protein